MTTFAAKYAAAKMRGRKAWAVKKAGEAVQVINAHPQGLAVAELCKRLGVSINKWKWEVLPNALPHIDIVGSQKGGWRYAPKVKRATFD